ncbi:MAG: hypothetical protein IT243_06070 [Bacteroidia bacterium]|nr:hypothetical protein [Bacteroidia bacterium]
MNPTLKWVLIIAVVAIIGYFGYKYFFKTTSSSNLNSSPKNPNSNTPQNNSGQPA